MHFSKIRRALVIALSSFAFFALARPAPIAEPVTIDKILVFLRENPEVRSVDALLSYLPTDFLSNFTLMYASHSLQKATPEAPRAIVFGRDARFVLAFNGSPDEFRYDSLETFQFRDADARFEFREIVFPRDPRSEQAVQVSPVNPPRCLQCHFSDPRPNWEHYSTWPGAFASEDDELTGRDKELTQRLQAFLGRASQLDRYRWLVNVAGSYESKGFRTNFEHNIILTHRLSQLNFKRVARAMRELPDYPKLKYLMMGTIYCDETLHRFFPTAISSSLREIERAVVSVQGLGDTAGALPALGSALGLDGRSWYMDFIARAEQLSLLTPLNTQQMLSAAIVEKDADLRPYFTLQPDKLYGEDGFRAYGRGDICSIWAEKSRTLLARWPSR